MVNFVDRINGLVTAIKTETKALRVFISGTNNGDTSALDTVSTNLVSAINEVKNIADSAAGGGVAIDDANKSAASTYSSNRIEAYADAAAAAVKSQILNGVGPELDTLIEIASKLGENENTDAALAAVVANKANTSEVYTQAQIGDITTDFAAVFAAA